MFTHYLNKIENIKKILEQHDLTDPRIKTIVNNMANDLHYCYAIFVISNNKTVNFLNNVAQENPALQKNLTLAKQRYSAEYEKAPLNPKSFRSLGNHNS